MGTIEPRSPSQVLRTYFHGKDENRPRLLDGVFAPDATLEVRNHAQDISFPAVTEGRGAIADVLVGRFAQTYENVYSFYMSRPTSETVHFNCDWLVGMTGKLDGQVRVGCGRYEWSFQDHAPGLTERLVIEIVAMQVLPAVEREAVFDWFARLDYPWSTAAAVVDQAPPLPGLDPVLRFLGRGESPS
jgi:hypothetical protein